MMFGTQRHFGIECYVRNAQNQSIIGDLWLWGNDMRIGDEVGGVDLPLILNRLSGPLFLGERHRHDDFFDLLSEAEVATFFCDLIFSHKKTPQEIAEIALLFRRFLVISAPDLEGFDSVFVLLLGRRDTRDRLIWKGRESDAVQECLLSPGEYSDCVLSCFDWLQEETGYRARSRHWLGLEESQREELRQSILTRNPRFRETDRFERLDEVAIEELNRKMS